jgi:GT2 family glycosyltransferase
MSPPSDPRVAVVVTCHDLGAYLPEMIASLDAQTFRAYEAVIVDDGSTDPATLALLGDYEREGRRVLRTRHAGLPAAKNVGVRATRSEYISCVDADDRLEPAFLERSVDALDADPALAFVSHWVRTFGDDTGEWTPDRCDLPELADRNTINGAAVVRRSVLDGIGGFDETFREGCEDWDAWLSVVERGHRGAILPEVLYHYRRRADSMSVRMVAGDGHARLYRQLARKHAATFARHLPALLARREGDIAQLVGQIHDLELEYALRLAPAVAQHRDDARKTAGSTPGREGGAPATSAGDGIVSDEQAANAATRASLEAALDAARAEVDALRASWSWRITRPLRTVYGWLRGVAGGQP